MYVSSRHASGDVRYTLVEHEGEQSATMSDVTDPAAPRTVIDPATTPRGAIYHLLNSIVAPRPIA